MSIKKYKSFMAYSGFSTIGSYIRNGSSGPVGDITSGLLVYYKCKTGDISGSTLTDYSGTSHNATTSGSPTISSSSCPKASYAITLSSSSSQYLTIPSFTCSSASMTIACWLNMKSTTGWPGRVFCSTSGYNSTYLNSIFSGSSSSSGGGTENLESSGQYYQPFGAPSVGWHHFIYIFKPGSPLVIYFDGVKYTSSTNCGNLPTNNGANVFATNWIGYDGGTPVSNFDIAEYRVYNRALAALDATTLYGYTQA